MKYVMLETADGQKLPILFPEALVHRDVSDVMGRLVDRTMGPKALGRRRTLPSSAGFVGFTGPVAVHGKSETLGDMQSKPLDAARIIAGSAVSFMPDAMLAPVAARLLTDPLREAAQLVEQWWLAEGQKHFNGAPACIFALRAALNNKDREDAGN